MVKRLLLGFSLAIFVNLWVSNCSMATTAWLSVCNSETSGNAVYESKYKDATGNTNRLTISQKQLPNGGGNCYQIQLPIAATEVQWAGLISRNLGKTLDSGVILQGIEKNGEFQVSEILPRDETQASPDRVRTIAMPIDTNLLPDLQAKPFGREERVSLRRENSNLVIECHAGTAPAGVIIQGKPWYLPPYLELSLQLVATSSDRFSWGVSDSLRATQGDPLILGTTPTLEKSQLTALKTPKELKDWDSWSVVCPTSAATLTITDLRLTATQQQTAKVGKAFWFWQPRSWQQTPEKLLSQLQQLQAERVYISVPLTASNRQVAHPQKLQKFIADAIARKIQVWVVEGDPHAVLPQERHKFVQRAKAYAAYNQSVGETARIAGIQYDIEPYLVSGYNLNKSAWNQAYLDTIAALKSAISQPLEVALPFWFSQAEIDGESLLNKLAPHVDAIVVMDYTTKPVLIQQFAEPFLAWGIRYKKPVRIALEAGELPDEVQHYYQQNSSGQLWYVPNPQDSHKDILLLLKSANHRLNGQGFMYERTGVFLSKNITFNENREALKILLPKLSDTFTSWSSFSGFALHGFES